MRLIFVADVHLGAYREFNVNGSRLERCFDAMRQVLATAVAHGVSHIIDCGDLIDRKNLIDLTTYNRIFRFFRDEVQPTGIPYTALAGNHNISGVSGETNLLPLTEFITEVKQPSTLALDGVTLHLIPFYRNEDDWMVAYHNAQRNAAPGRNILVGHQEIKGAVTGTHRYVAGGGLDRSKVTFFDHCIFGHYHQFQVWGDNMQVFYAGALLQQDFGEINNSQGFWIYDTDTGVWQWYQVEVPRFLVTDDPLSTDDYNYWNVNTDQSFTPVNHDDHVRVSTTPLAKEVDRLSASGNIDQMIEAYLSEKAPPQHLDLLRHILKEVSNEHEPTSD